MTEVTVKTTLRTRTIQLSIHLIKFLSRLPRTDPIRIISNQLIRSGTSIGANVHEAKSSSSKKDFVNYYQIALKSANESKYWIELLKEIHPSVQVELSEFGAEIDELSRMLGSSVVTLKRSQ